MIFHRRYTPTGCPMNEAIQELSMLRGLQCNLYFDFIHDDEIVLFIDGDHEARIVTIDHFRSLAGHNVIADANDSDENEISVSVRECFSLKRQRFLHRRIFTPMRRLWFYYKWKRSLHAQVIRLCRPRTITRCVLHWCNDVESMKHIF